MDDFGLIKIVDRFGKSVAETVDHASDRRLYASLRQSLRIANRDILRAADGMMNQPATYMKSESQGMFGAGALKGRLTRSSGQGVDLSAIVVLIGLPRMMP